MESVLFSLVKQKYYMSVLAFTDYCLEKNLVAIMPRIECRFLVSPKRASTGSFTAADFTRIRRC